MRELIFHTFREHLKTLRFSVGMAMAVLMVVGVTVVKLEEYKAYKAAEVEIERSIMDSRDSITAWSMARTTMVLPLPDLSFMATGLAAHQPNQVEITAGRPATLLQMTSFYSDNPLLKILPNLDVTEVAILFFSLLAVLFSFDLVNGARERGVLRMLVAYGKGRIQTLTGLALGGLLTVLLFVVIGLLSALLTVQFYSGIPLTPQFIAGFSLIGLAVLLYCLIFFAVGLLFSSLTRHSNLSLMFSLFIWVVCVVAMPMLLKQLVVETNPIPPIDEIQHAHRELDREFQQKISDWSRKYITDWIAENEPIGDVYWGSNTGNIFDMSLSNVHYIVRTPFDVLIDFARARRAFKEPLRQGYIDRLEMMEVDYENKMYRQANTANAIANLSPANVLRHLAAIVTGTDEGALMRFVKAARVARKEYVAFQQSKDYGSMDFTTDQHRDGGPLDLGGMPAAEVPNRSLAETIGDAGTDFALLLLPLIVLLIAGGIVFSRYDIR